MMTSTLNIFDIDETIFHTYARVLVRDEYGTLVCSLDNAKFSEYRLKDGERFDFSEFKSAEKFYATSKPIKKMIDLLVDLTESSEVVIVTARQDLDDRDLFLKTFVKHGVSQISKIHIHRAGNHGHGPADQNKKIVIKKLLDCGRYSEAKLYDDSRSNLKMFNSLQSDYPSIRFQSFLAFPDGSVQLFNEI